LGQPDIGVLSNSTDRTIRPGDYTLPPLKDWKFTVDNEFAERMLSNLTVYIKSHKPGALCSRCIGLNFWAPAFNLGVAIADLCARSATCEFCRLLVRICERNANVTDGEVHFERRQSNLALLEDSYPILSIFRTPVPGKCNLRVSKCICFADMSRPATARSYPNWITGAPRVGE
jgi:hypothetical protein